VVSIVNELRKEKKEKGKEKEAEAKPMEMQPAAIEIVSQGKTLGGSTNKKDQENGRPNYKVSNEELAYKKRMSLAVIAATEMTR
jgi:hypothetical protein